MNMQNLRKYGSEPFSVAVIHGGPGAPGEMAPVARELSSLTGVLEPLQTAKTIEGQVQELRAVLAGNGALPVTLIGFSWGAMLGFIFTARFPSFVSKLVLVSSGTYEAEYAVDIMETRLSRLSTEKREEVFSLMQALDDSTVADKRALMARFGELMFEADSCSPIPRQNEILEYNYDILQSVWEEARELRNSGRLLALGKKVRCPVVAIHGDYDPHLYEGVRVPLSRVLKDFKFVLLEKCGHYPWLELNARDEFYQILRSEILSVK